MARDKMCAKGGRKGIKSIARCAAILVAGALSWESLATVIKES